MEWVETTAKTVDEAKDLALDKLGIDVDEAEFQILEEPKAGLFGRTRGEARVRARIAPRVPRPKQERRDRKRGSTRGRPKAAETDTPGASTVGDGESEVGQAEEGAATPAKAPSSAGAGGSRSRRGRGSGAKAKPEKDTAAADPSSKKPTASRAEARKDEDIVTVTLAEQTEMASEFLQGLLASFGLDGDLAVTEVDEETNEIDVQGEDLGLLIGPRGQTISAVQELTRTVLQRRAGGSYEGRVRVDVSGYRQRRREALVRFATQVAEQVRSTGGKKALEPMNAADRKVVHDTINEIEGVRTSSEGEEPRRWVVIHPEG